MAARAIHNRREATQRQAVAKLAQKSRRITDEDNEKGMMMYLFVILNYNK